MTAAARNPASLPKPSSASARMPATRRQPRERRAFRRSDAVRYQPQELSLPAQPSPWQRAWARYAIPGGLTAFWLVFVASNWDRLAMLLGLN